MASKDKQIVAILNEERAIDGRLGEIEREERRLRKRQGVLVDKKCRIAARKLKGYEVVLRGGWLDEPYGTLNGKIGRMLKTTKGNCCLVDFGADGTHELHLLDVMAADEELWHKLCEGEQVV